MPSETYLNDDMLYQNQLLTSLDSLSVWCNTSLLMPITGCDIGNAYLEALTNRELYMLLPYDWTGRDDKGNPRKISFKFLYALFCWACHRS